MRKVYAKEVQHHVSGSYLNDGWMDEISPKHCVFDHHISASYLTPGLMARRVNPSNSETRSSVMERGRPGNHEEY